MGPGDGHFKLPFGKLTVDMLPPHRGPAPPHAYLGPLSSTTSEEKIQLCAVERGNWRAAQIGGCVGDRVGKPCVGVTLALALTK